MRPSARLSVIAGLVCLFSVLAAWWSVPAVLVAAVVAVMVLVAAVDCLRLWRSERPVVQRELPAIVPVKRPFSAQIHLQHNAERTVSGELSDQSPDGVQCTSGAQTLSLAPGSNSLDLCYCAARRGSVSWQWLQWTDNSRWGLWRRRSLLPCASQLAVYPDYASARRQLNISLSRSLRELGIVQRQRGGDSQEFHQLRAYQQGDALRQIDWKATARRQKLVARQYAEESNQSLVLMLDCGRRMSLRHGERELLDEAMDATLMAAEIALRQGDRVSVQCFAAEPFYWSGQNRTPQALSAMLAQLHDVRSRPEASDYVAAAQALRGSLKQRSTIVLVTHSRSENMEELSMAARVLGDKHSVVVADINDGELKAVLGQQPQDFESALSYAGAVEYRDKRWRAQQNLRKLGTDVMDVGPQQLVAALVQAYQNHRGRAA